MIELGKQLFGDVPFGSDFLVGLFAVVIMLDIFSICTDMCRGWHK